eukprot:GHVU01061827.1.p1 GENE.GHVU01061827.1~~GHVU01061827.1.p1  ORF type:complete len:264 (+),score=26.35 GHVU01061827.1:728-1519(+)
MPLAFARVPAGHSYVVPPPSLRSSGGKRVPVDGHSSTFILTSNPLKEAVEATSATTLFRSGNRGARRNPKNNNGRSSRAASGRPSPSSTWRLARHYGVKTATKAAPARERGKFLHVQFADRGATLVCVRLARRHISSDGGGGAGVCLFELDKSGARIREAATSRGKIGAAAATDKRHGGGRWVAFTTGKNVVVTRALGEGSPAEDGNRRPEDQGRKATTGTADVRFDPSFASPLFDLVARQLHDRTVAAAATTKSVVAHTDSG